MENVGIYKIENPEGLVYIGQSKNIKKRMIYFKAISDKCPRKLYTSLLKYGFQNHKVEIAHALPIDVSQEVLDRYEKLYMESYKDCGVELLNIREGGKRGRQNEESKALMALGNKGKKASEETKQRMSVSAKIRYAFYNPLKGRKLSEEARLKRCKSVIDTATGIIYTSCKEAAIIYEIGYSSLSDYLTGKRPNKTTLKYYTDAG